MKTPSRKNIELNMNFMDVITVLAEGNPGAVTVLASMLKNPDGLFHMLHLDDMNIRGSQIWIGYKYYCEQDLGRFTKCILDRDAGMVAKINEMNQEQGDCWRAVTSGASFGERPTFKYGENHEY